MARQKFSNNGASKLAGALTNSATALAVTATEGSKFPTLGAGDTFPLNLVKLVGGLPVIEIVRVTARSGDNMTILRAQEGTTATTFSAGDIVELRLTGGALDNFAQQGGDNVHTGANDFTGASSVTLPTVLANDNSQKGAYTGWVRGYAAAKGANSDITSLSGLTTALSVAQGGTGATAGPQACINLGAVQQGTGTGQNPSNVIKIGWGTTTGGLKATVDTTDLGYIPFSTTNPNSGAVITFANPLTALAASFTTISASGLLSASLGLSVTGAASLINGGTTATLGNNGYLQIGSAGGLNVVADFNKYQARNNGAAATLNLNPLGGLVQVGAGGLTVGGTVSTGILNTAGRIFAQNAGDDKISLYAGAVAQGHIGADGSTCFKVANAAFSVYVLALDNSGNMTATGNITANSDERLKENWRYLPEDFLDRLAEITLLGVYDRTDIPETQLGMSAQQVQAFAPWLVHENPSTGLLSLDYGKLGGVAAARLAQVVRTQRREIDLLKQCMEHVMNKLGAV